MVGGGVASHKWWERLARQTEGTPAISIREGTCAVCLCGMDTYLQRSTIGVCGGWGGRDLTIEVQWLVYVWRRRETYLMY